MRRRRREYAPDDPTVFATAPGSSVRLRGPAPWYDVVVGDWSVDALIGLRHRLLVIRHQLDEADRRVDGGADSAGGATTHAAAHDGVSTVVADAAVVL